MFQLKALLNGDGGWTHIDKTSNVSLNRGATQEQVDLIIVIAYGRYLG